MKLQFQLPITFEVGLDTKEAWLTSYEILERIRTTLEWEDDDGTPDEHVWAALHHLTEIAKGAVHSALWAFVVQNLKPGEDINEVFEKTYPPITRSVWVTLPEPPEKPED